MAGFASGPLYLHKKEVGRVHSVRQHLMTEAQRAAFDAKHPELVAPPSVNRPRPEFRDFGVGAQILRHCGVSRMTLLSNSDRRLVGLDAYGLDLVATQPIPVPAYRTSS